MPDEPTNPTPPAEPKSEAFLDNIDQQFHSGISGFKTKNELAKGYGELYGKMGTAVQIPTEQTPPEEVAAFYRKVGAPEKPEDYELTMPEMPEGLSHDEKFEMTMRGIACEAGISKAHMKILFDAYNAYRISQHKETEDEGVRLIAEGDKALHEKWSVDYQKNFEIVDRACADLIPNEELRTQFAELVTSKGLRNNPVFAEVFLGIGKSMLDDTLTKGQLPQGDPGYTPASPSAPDMYAFGDSDDCKKARAYFRAKGHTYANTD